MLIFTEASFVIKLAKMPQNMKLSDRFRTVFDSVFLRPLFKRTYENFQLKYTVKIFRHFNN